MITRPTALRGVSRVVHAIVGGIQPTKRPMLAGVFAIAAMLCLSQAAWAVDITIDSPVAVSEGNVPALTPITFTVTLSAPATGGETFVYATGDDTNPGANKATAGLDYQAAVGVVTLNPGDTTVSIQVNIIGDDVAEGDETFAVTLSNLTGGLTPGASLVGIGTIADDQDKRRLQVADVEIAEGNAGVTEFVFTLELNPNDDAVLAIGNESIDVATANDTAIAGSDYLAISPTTVSFAAGEKTKEVKVYVLGDFDVEFTETFWLMLSNPVNLATPTQTSALGIIVTDEAWGPSVVVNGDTLGVTGTIYDDSITAVIITNLTAGSLLAAFAGQDAIPDGDPDTPGDQPVDAIPPTPALPAADTTIIQVLINGTLYPNYLGMPLTAPHPTPAEVQAVQAVIDAFKKDPIKFVIINGLSGDDVIDARLCNKDSGIQTLQYGGTGNDVLLAGENGDYLDGGPGNDYLLGGPGDDKAPDDFPNPYITGGAGDDIVDGGEGKDIISGGTGRNQLIGGKGDDSIVSEPGAYDVLDYKTSPEAVVVDLNAGTAANDGFDTKDTLQGTFSILRGSNGDDILTGYSDTRTIILGGFGNDTISGGPSGFSDILYGEDGNDIIYGDGVGATDGGGDILMGGSGIDLIFGGPGSDEIYGDGDKVPQNFDEPTTGIDYFPDDQMIQRTRHPLSQGAIPVVAGQYAIIAPAGILNIATCLSGSSDATVGGAFRLPASELYASPSTLAAPGVIPGSDAGYDLVSVTSGGGLFGGGGGDRIAGGGGSDDIYGGSDTYTTDKAQWDAFGDDHDIIYGDYVCNRTTSSYGFWRIAVPLVSDLTRDGGDDRIHAGFGEDMVFGGPGMDRINGNVQNDTIYGDFYFGSADDYLFLVNAFATIPASAGWGDIIRGNEGSDRLYGGPGDDVLIGGDPYDGEVLGEHTAEPPINIQINGIDVWINGDYIQGNAGSDYLVGCEVTGLPLRIKAHNNNPDYIDRGFPNSLTVGVDTGTQDTVDYSMVPSIADGGTGIVLELDSEFVNPDGEGGIDQIYAFENAFGTNNGDTLVGNDKDNMLVGGNGNDTLLGGVGNDYLYGMGGDDKIWGDRRSANGQPPAGVDDPARLGSDVLYGGSGDDWLFGEWGNDYLIGETGNNYLDGGNGTDVLYYGFSGPVIVNLSGANVDLTDWGTLAVAYNDRVKTATNNYHTWPLNPVSAIIPLGGFPAGSITVPDDATSPYPWGTITITFAGGDNVIPGFDYDPTQVVVPDDATFRGLGVAFHNGTNYDLIVNRDQGATPVVPGVVANLSRFEIVYGSAGGDVIYGHGSIGTIVYGNAGNDILVGGAGNDSLYGGSGNDILEGGLGDNMLVGGDPPATPPGPQWESPSDWVSYYHAANGVAVNLGDTAPQNTINAGNDRIVEIQNILGSKFNDVLTGSSRYNILLGDDGNDVLAGRADNDIFQSNRYYVVSDTLDGGAGNDTADYRFGNPNLISIGACPAPNAADTCANNDGEGGSDRLFSIEAYNQPSANLQVALTPAPNKRTIVVGQSVKLEFTVTGGDGNYKAVFDPITAGEGMNEQAILAAPADQSAPVSPFTIDTPLPPYKAVRQLTGTADAGTWKFVVYARPLATTSFRVTVNDMATTPPGQDAPPPKQVAISVEVAIAGPLSVSILQSEYTIKAGESVQLQGIATGGTPPYTVLWTLADGSPATGLSATDILQPIANPTATTSYKLTVTDSTPDSSSQVMTATTKVTVQPAPAPPASSGSSIPPASGSNPGGSTAGGSTAGANSNAATNANQTPNEVSGKQESAPLVAVPACGFGVTSWVMVGNLLVMAVMKRRRW